MVDLSSVYKLFFLLRIELNEVFFPATLYKNILAPRTISEKEWEGVLWVWSSWKGGSKNSLLPYPSEKNCQKNSLKECVFVNSAPGEFISTALSTLKH